MLPDRSSSLRNGLILAIAIIVIAGTSLAKPVMAPLAMALFILCLAWPIQCALRDYISETLSAVTCICLTVITVSFFVFILAWSFGRIVSEFVTDAAQVQSAYGILSEMLKKFGLTFTDLSLGSLDVVSIFQFARSIATWLNGLITASAVVLVYVALGSLEIPAVGAILEHRASEGGKGAALALNAVRRAASNIRRYMIVRSGMSIVTGLAASILALAFGLKHVVEWGAAIFALNYIPFIGPFIGTVSLTFHALMHQHGYGIAIAIFLTLNFIQFALGSYIEPKVSGHQLSISPFFILFSVFFGMFIWGIPGAFLGVPAAICLLSYLEARPEPTLLLELLRGRRAQRATTQEA